MSFTTRWFLDKLGIVHFILWILLVTILFLLLFKSHHLTLRYAAFYATIFAWFAFLFIWVNFNKFNPFQWTNVRTITQQWFEKALGISDFYISIDGISIGFLALTFLLFPLCILYTWDHQKNVRYLLILLLLLEVFISLAFFTSSLLFYYIFFEATLIPMFFLIRNWGPTDGKIRASNYLYIYTVVGSSFFLIAVILLTICYNSTYYWLLSVNFLTFEVQVLFACLIFIGLAVKVPICPFHLWLIEAHLEAPTVASVILAALILKIGGYGFIRFPTLFCPVGFHYISCYANALCLVSIIIPAGQALVESDLKRVIAYSSIIHMNMALLGIFTGTLFGIMGGLLLMLAHGLTSSGLFFIVGCLYDRFHTRKISDLGGLAMYMPNFSTCYFILTLANISFPCTLNFAGEFLIFLGLGKAHSWGILVPIIISCFVNTVFNLLIFNHIVFGNAPVRAGWVMRDLDRRETYVLGTLIGYILLFGIFPNYLAQTFLASIALLSVY